MVLNIYRFQFPGVPQVHCLFQGRSICEDGLPNAGNISFKIKGGNARETRISLAMACAPQGLDFWHEVNQVHGDRIAVVSGKTNIDGSLPDADGMMTDRIGEGLLVKTADCQPILFAHKSGKSIMAIHAGWRGNRLDFPFTATLAFCARYGLNPEDVLAVRGPSLGPANAEFTNFDSEWGESYREFFDADTTCMNLWKLTASQLMRAGIPEKNIYGLDICTAANDDQFFSYRRDRECGRQASIIWIEGK